jgi:hypothetical protein
MMGEGANSFLGAPERLGGSREESKLNRISMIEIQKVA